MKILIAGSTHVNNFWKRDLLSMWAACLEQKNPDCDLLCVDSCSPITPESFLQWGVKSHFCDDPLEFERLSKAEKKTIIRFVDDIKHPFYGGGTLDAGSQALALMASYAITHGYDYWAYIEGDVLFAEPIRAICEKMEKHKIGWATMLDPVYRWIQSETMFFSVEWLKSANFIERFAWKTPVQAMDRMSYVEVRLERTFKDDLWVLPLRGFKNESNQVKWDNVSKMAGEQGLSYLTHCPDFGLYEKFLHLHGVSINGG
jgi:hypothetical protein